MAPAPDGLQFIKKEMTLNMKMSARAVSNPDFEPKIGILIAGNQSGA